VGILVGIAFTWRVMDKVFFGEPGHSASAHHGAFPPISMAELAGAVILLAATLAVGLYPRMLLDLIVPSFHSPLFDGLLKGGMR
jgi:NADH-quinone oxidoreductase subunit M